MYSAVTPFYLFQFFSGHFDTTTGPKMEADSYRKIAAAIGTSPDQILFVTDIPKGTHDEPLGQRNIYSDSQDVPATRPFALA